MRGLLEKIDKHKLYSGSRHTTLLATTFLLYNEDTAAGLLATALSNARGIFNLSSGSAVPVRDIAMIIRDHVAPGLDLVFGDDNDSKWERAIAKIGSSGIAANASARWYAPA